MKFLRNYEIRIKTDKGQEFTIAPPVSVSLTTDISYGSSVNNCNVTLYNLAPSTRGYLYKDKYSTPLYWQISILAGYGENELYEIFRGNIQQCFSYKKNTEWITEIEAYDGSYQIAEGFVSETVAGGTNILDAVKRIIHTMPQMLMGAMGTPTNGTLTRGQTFEGPSYDKLQELVGGNAFVDQETIHILGQDEIIDDGVFYLSGEDFYETPRRRDTWLELSTLFSPYIRIGRVCEIKSAEKIYNGQYEVRSVKHTLTVSQASSGDATTMLGLYAGAAAFIKVSL
jgi:hypothetical protein